MGTTQRMAQFITQARFEDIPEPAADMAKLCLPKQQPFTADEIQEIFIETTDNPSCMAPNIRWPQSGLEGKSSIWYTAASIAVDGKLDLSSFTDEAAKRPAVGNGLLGRRTRHPRNDQGKGHEQDEIRR